MLTVKGSSKGQLFSCRLVSCESYDGAVIDHEILACEKNWDVEKVCSILTVAVPSYSGKRSEERRVGKECQP